MAIHPCVRVTARQLLHPDECREIRERLAELDWLDTTVRDETRGDTHDRRRRGGMHRVEHEPLLDRIRTAVITANREDYEFDARGFDPADPIFYLRYRTNDHFDWHADNATTAHPIADRKLSVVIQLSPSNAYEGGDLELAMYAPHISGNAETTAQLRREGSMICFPSYMLHRVSPVRGGIRYAIVAWLHGPRFR